MNAIFGTAMPVFLIVLVGYLIGKYKKVNVEPFVNLIVYISGPALIFSSITKSDINLTDFLTMALSAIGVILILLFVVFIILKFSKSQKIGLYLPISIGNTGYLGYPVALFAFGIAGLSRAVVFDMMSSLVLYSFGIYIITHRSEIMEVLKIPLLYAVVVGLFFNLLKIPVNEIVAKPIEMIGMITIPLALLILGYKLTKIKVSAAKIALFASLFKIIGGFLIAFLIIKMFSITGLVRNIILLQAAMPSAVMGMILCQKYRRDANLVASVVFISTLLSIITIPLILWFL